MSNKKKILFAYDCMMLGGTTTALLSLLNEFDYSKYDVDLIMYKNSGEAIERIPAEVNILPPAKRKCRMPEQIKKAWHSVWNGQFVKAILLKLFDRSDNKKKSWKMVLWQSTEKAHARISRKLADEYDVAIGYIESWGAHYVASNKVKAKRKIIWVHLDVKNSYMIPAIDLYMYKKVDKIVTVSRQCCENLMTMLPTCSEKICFIENVLSKIDVNKRANEQISFPVDHNKINFVSVCRIAFAHKGLDRGLHAIKWLKEEGVALGFVWYLIGDGPDASESRSFIEENNLQDNVVLLGSISNPMPYEKEMTFFFLPSRYEGKPMAVTEAQMLGLPCVVTEYASASEQIRDNVDGLILNNDDEAVYTFLRNLCLGKYDFSKMRENVLCKQFSNEETLKKHEELLE